MPDPILRVENLQARYGERRVLHDVSFQVFPREIRVILGGSGSGKSTLIKHMLRLAEPSAGRVSILGREITDLDEEELNQTRLRVGFLFQNGALLGSLTVAENVAMPLEMHTSLPPAVIQTLVHQRLTQVGLATAGEYLPAELSGGMRKRAALARALILDPPLLVCDEPSAGLDPVTARQLDALLLDLRRQLGTTLIVVTHEIASIRRIADRILFLEKGGVAFDGTLAAAATAESAAVRAFFAPDDTFTAI
jgi:phospholipid/cholesterol/gamma-HCH transport system ATP-binding protein